MEQQVLKIRKTLKAAQDRQKSYVDKHRMNREFSIGDHVYLRVKAKKVSLKLGICAKLSPRYYGSFEVLEIIGPIAYGLAFPNRTKARIFFMFLSLRNMYMILTM